MAKPGRPPLTEAIPAYLKPYIADQDASLYTPIDHASWRFIMKISKAFFARHAHQKYLDGLKETGITTDRIPLIEEMDQHLRKFNWRAVAVSGFIPPAVFMEFLSLGILPIACDMRQLEHLAYTPAPDIVHEAAGHAPIIADPEYADYLRHYGEISQKAIFSTQDQAVYEAVRNLSEVKEDPHASPQTIQAAQKRLDEAATAVDHVSEATMLARMSWWTIEYGLVGDASDPKIYGAGLLSSVGESYHCLNPDVPKIPFSLDCIHMSYDITRPQPQLYLAPDFQSLTRILKELGETMAHKKGGKDGLFKAMKAATVTTAVLDSGLQISGRLANVILGPKGEPCYLQYAGPTQLAYQNHELAGQGADYHREGFGSPVGLTQKDLDSLKRIESGTKAKITFESGVNVEGTLKSRTEKNGHALLFSFEECKITHSEKVLFQPEWGTYDMACGGKVVSVHNGAADAPRYLEVTGGYKQLPRRQKTNLTNENRELNDLYAITRKARESGNASGLDEVHELLEKKYPNDWLLRYELLELIKIRGLKAPWEKQVRKRLLEISTASKEKAEMIQRGLELL